MALSTELYAYCYEVLLKCAEFDSYESLRAIFVTSELVFCRDRLPRCNNKEDQVTQTIECLLAASSGAQPVLPLFLAMLRERRHPRDSLRNQLDDLYLRVEHELGPGASLTGHEQLVIPFVVAAMNQAEASVLFDESVFRTPDVAPSSLLRFREFRHNLEEVGDFSALQSHYVAARDDWVPLFNQPLSMKVVINKMLEHINQHYRISPDMLPLKPYFLTDEFFSTERSQRSSALLRLRQSGGVLILDSISMFHPAVSRSVARSDIGANRQVAILVISPTDTSKWPLNKLIESVIDSEMETVFTRFAGEFDRLCEIKEGNLRSLQRWLFAVLPDTAANLEKRRPAQANLELLRQMQGSGQQYQNINRYFFGQGDF
ncbi:MAG: hypothetical protein JW981_07650 [Anaerolineae bacterium]|nr:hypothetical protein [Anaerolineae bacterium]